MPYSQTTFVGAEYVARLGDHERYLTNDCFELACTELLKLNGGVGVPDVKKVNGDSTTDKPVVKLAKPAPVQLSLPTTPKKPAVAAGEMDDEGLARSEKDMDAAIGAGFAPAQTVVVRGLRVNDLGVKNATTAREEFEKMPLSKVAATDFRKHIVEEVRKADVVNLNEIRFNAVGEVVPDKNKKLPINVHGFQQILRRAGEELAAGARYLSYCDPELRAKNVNNWLLHYNVDELKAQSAYDEQAKGMSEKRAKRLYGKRPEAQQIKLLTRNNTEHASGREIFGAVGRKFPHQFDVGTIAEAIEMVAPPQARGTVTYDGVKARFQMLFHSTVQPEDFVAGEFFRAGVQISTDDTGGGSCVIDAIIWQNLCLNLIVIDRAVNNISRIRHIGDARVLAGKFDKGIKLALDSIKYFTDQWGFAMHENVLQRTADITPDYASELLKAMEGSLPVSAVLPGLFNGIIERDLVPIRGKRQEVLKKLMYCYDEDTTNATSGKIVPISRAGILNSFTRYAGEFEPDNGLWGEDELQRAAGKLLTIKAKGARLPPPLPYVPLSA